MRPLRLRIDPRALSAHVTAPSPHFPKKEAEKLKLLAQGQENRDWNHHLGLEAEPSATVLQGAGGPQMTSHKNLTSPVEAAVQETDRPRPPEAPGPVGQRRWALRGGTLAAVGAQ